MAKAPDVVDLLALAVERGASDLVITVGLPPMLKIDGEFHPTEYEPLTPQETRRLMYALMDEKQQRIFEEEKELDFSFSLPGPAFARLEEVCECYTVTQLERRFDTLDFYRTMKGSVNG